MRMSDVITQMRSVVPSLVVESGETGSILEKAYRLAKDADTVQSEEARRTLVRALVALLAEATGAHFKTQIGIARLSRLEQSYTRVFLTPPSEPRDADEDPLQMKLEGIDDDLPEHGAPDCKGDKKDEGNENDDEGN